MLKITIITVGKKHEAAFAQKIDEYEKRLRSDVKMSWHIIPSSDKQTESQKILDTIKEDEIVVLLDERGKMVKNDDIVAIFEKTLHQYKNLTIIIGGAYGVNELVMKRADAIWAISGLVLPHQMVRLVLSEQIYRTVMIMREHPYHHIA